MDPKCDIEGKIASQPINWRVLVGGDQAREEDQRPLAVGARIEARDSEDDDWEPDCTVVAVHRIEKAPLIAEWLEKVKRNGAYVLGAAPLVARADRDFMLAAVANGGNTALKYAAKELMADVDFLRAAPST